MTPYSDVLASDLVHEHAGLLAKAVAEVADPQIRHRGTIGGALVHADPAGDVGAPVLALDAELVIAGAGGERTVPAAEFFHDLFETSVAEGELLTEVRIPKHTGWGVALREVRAGRRTSGRSSRSRWRVRAEGGTISEARIGLTNMGNTPLRARGSRQALVGRSAADLGDACDAVADGTNPPSDLNGDADYRRHLARVLTRRAVLDCAAEADHRMELTHDFTVPASVDDAWATFMDLERVGSCFPGAAVTSVDESGFAGTVKVKLGPIALQYAGTGSSSSATTRRTGPSSRPRARTSGATARPAPRSPCSSRRRARAPASTSRPTCRSPASRPSSAAGVMQDVSDKLLQQFVACIEGQFAPAEPAADATADAGAAARLPAPVPRRPPPDRRPPAGPRSAGSRLRRERRGVRSPAGSGPQPLRPAPRPPSTTRSTSARRCCRCWSRATRRTPSRRSSGWCSAG